MEKTKTLLTSLLAVLAITVVAAMPMALAAETVTTVAHFNVPSSVAFEVTLPGESAVESTGGGAATTEIEFNCSNANGSESDVEAKVVGGTVQSDGTPIYEIDNIGTVNINVTIALNASMPACMTLQGGTTYGGISTTITDSPQDVVTDFTPAASAQDYYLQTDFSACTAGDSTTRTITLSGDTA